MPGFIGEFPCTMDAKGRFNFPSALLKQVPAKEQKGFVVHRGIETHLVLYTKKEWERISEEVNRKNIYVEDNREFIRIFNHGATVVELDSTNRILLPQGLMDYAHISRDIVLFAYAARIEIWSQKEYDKMLKKDRSNFSKLAERVMGNKTSE